MCDAICCRCSSLCLFHPSQVARAARLRRHPDTGAVLTACISDALLAAAAARISAFSAWGGRWQCSSDWRPSFEGSVCGLTTGSGVSAALDRHFVAMVAADIYQIRVGGLRGAKYTVPSIVCGSPRFYAATHAWAAEYPTGHAETRIMGCKGAAERSNAGEGHGRKTSD
jgi:hypothetical protein